jgi:hypothetical protein
MIDGRRSFGSASACQCGLGSQPIVIQDRVCAVHARGVVPLVVLAQPLTRMVNEKAEGLDTSAHCQESRSPSFAWILVVAGWNLVAPLAQSWRGRREMPSRQHTFEFKLSSIPVATVSCPFHSPTEFVAPYSREGRTWNGQPPPRCVVQAAPERSSLEISTTLNA